MESHVGLDVPLLVCNCAARLVMSHRFVQRAARSKQLLCPASQFQPMFLSANGVDLALVPEMQAASTYSWVMLFLQDVYR